MLWLALLVLAALVPVDGTTTVASGLSLPTTKSKSGIGSSTGVEAALRILRLSDEQQDQAKEPRPSAKQPRSSSLLPFVTISYAQTLDGSIAPLNRSRLDISSQTSFRLLHSLRARHDGVLVGINTVVCDGPRLNVRDPLPGISIPAVQPRPVVIDSDLRILQVSDLKLEQPIVCSCLLDGLSSSQEMDEKWLAAREKLEAIGGVLVSCKRLVNELTGGPSNKCDLQDCLRVLRDNQGFKSILVEGGAGIIQSLLEHDLVDQFVVTIRPCFFGGYRSMTRQLTTPTNMQDISVASVGGDICVHGCRLSEKTSNTGEDFLITKERQCVSLVV